MSVCVIPCQSGCADSSLRKCCVCRAAVVLLEGTEGGRGVPMHAAAAVGGQLCHYVCNLTQAQHITQRQEHGATGTPWHQLSTAGNTATLPLRVAVVACVVATLMIPAAVCAQPIDPSPAANAAAALPFLPFLPLGLVTGITASSAAASPASASGSGPSRKSSPLFLRPMASGCCCAGRCAGEAVQVLRCCCGGWVGVVLLGCMQRHRGARLNNP